MRKQFWIKVAECAYECGNSGCPGYHPVTPEQRVSLEGPTLLNYEANRTNAAESEVVRLRAQAEVNIDTLAKRCNEIADLKAKLSLPNMKCGDNYHIFFGRNPMCNCHYPEEAEKGVI